MVRRWLCGTIMLAGVLAFPCLAETSPRTVWLDDLAIQKILTGWGKVERNKSVDKNPIKIGGKMFERGVGVHAVSYAKILLDGKAEFFEALVGVDDEMWGKGSIEFVVVADGKIAWRSGVMHGGMEARRLHVPLRGVRVLELRVEDAGDGIGQDHADWAMARFVVDGDSPKIVSVQTIPVLPPTPRPVSPTNRSEARAPLIPYPRIVQWKTIDCPLDRVRLVLPAKENEQLHFIAKTLRQILGRYGVKVAGRSEKAQATITLAFGDVPESRDGSEAYRLSVKANGVRIVAPDTRGLFYGVQTLRQLVTRKRGRAIVVGCEIVDWPAFPWRGFMHDVGRNFQDPELLKRFLDVMAHYKLNVFHFHLADRPGYRIECRIHPELNDPKSYRPTRQPGKYYTYDQLNDLIHYCRLRNIMIVPEIDMPGHSDYFRKAFGVDMQDPKGMKILSDVLTEFFQHVELPYFHMGSDEVRIRNKDFMPTMAKLIRRWGKQIIVWRPGNMPDKQVITQLWTGGSWPVPGVRFLDSRANYLNHMDPFVGPLRVFMQQPCRVEHSTALALGGILCHWPDNNVGEQINVYRQSPVFPVLLAYAERLWRGAKNNRPDCWARLPSEDDPAFKEFVEFERDLIAHRDKFFQDWPFQYVKQTQICWRLIGPFDNGGNTLKKFPVEDEIKDVYVVDGKRYTWLKEEVRGATVYLNHPHGFRAWLPRPRGMRGATVYALTYIHSPRDQAVDFWIGFNTYSRSGGRSFGPTPKLGQWSHADAKVWVNDREVAPPAWKHPGLAGSPEIPFVDENYFHREPTRVYLRKGWNKILLKIPRGRRPIRWMFTCTPVAWDGQHVREVTGLFFATEPKGSPN